MRGRSGDGIKLYDHENQLVAYITLEKALRKHKDKTAYVGCERCGRSADHAADHSCVGGRDHRFACQEYAAVNKMWATVTKRTGDCRGIVAANGQLTQCGPGRPEQQLITGAPGTGRTFSNWQPRSNGYPERMRVQYKDESPQQ